MPEIKDKLVIPPGGSLEFMTADHRQLIVVLVTQAYVRIRNDPEMRDQAAECDDLLRLLSGETTRVAVIRSISSQPAR